MKRSYFVVLTILGLFIIPNLIWFSMVLPDLKDDSKIYEMFFEITAVLDAADFVGDELETIMTIHTFELNVLDSNGDTVVYL